jgi:hypothetical protein
VRIASALLLILALAGCNRGLQNNDAVRQGVLDYLQKIGMNMGAMDVNVTSVKFNGNKADANVSFAVKGTGGAAMTIIYNLEQKDNKWVVVGKQDSSQHGAAAGAGAMGGGENPHAGGAMPGGTPSPHAGGAMPAAPSGGKMPAPEDLPPAGKKK